MLAPTTEWVNPRPNIWFHSGGVRLKENISIVTFLLFQHEIAIVTEEGVEIIGPLSSETNWDIAHMVRLGFVVLMVTADCGLKFSMAAVCWGDKLRSDVDPPTLRRNATYIV